MTLFAAIQERLSSKDEEDESDKKSKGKEKEKAGSDEKVVGLNSPVAKIDRKRDDDARAKLWEARRVARGQVVAAAPVDAAKAEVQQRLKLEAPRTKKEEEEALQRVLELSEKEMMQRLAEEGEKAQVERATQTSLEESEDSEKKPKSKNKRKRQDEDEDEDLGEVEGELMRQAMAASMTDF